MLALNHNTARELVLVPDRVEGGTWSRWGHDLGGPLTQSGSSSTCELRDLRVWAI